MTRLAQGVAAVPAMAATEQPDSVFAFLAHKAAGDAAFEEPT
jgi:hypothetical protein